MFRKRSVCKEQIRQVRNCNSEESGQNVAKQRLVVQGPLDTDIDEIKRRSQLKKDSDRLKDSSLEKDERLDDLISIVSHKSSRKFSHNNIVNNYDLDLDAPDPPKKEPSRSIYSEKKYEILESRNPNVKLTLRMDYQHDICKDFKETGYCGFGDTCKFLHDRSDFKSGWQLDKEWDSEQRKKRQRTDFLLKGSRASGQESNQSKSPEPGQPPKKCLICKKKWNSSSNPVVTLCNHHFCEACALNHYTSTSKCFHCGLPTKGTFNIASIPLNQTSETESQSSSDSESSSPCE